MAKVIQLVASINNQYPVIFICRNLVLSVLIAIFNPFGLGDYTDSYTQNMIARFAAPFYGNKGQSEVVVVQLNDQVLRELNQSWPLSYSYQARLLRQILSYEPKAVFVDFIYTQDRKQKGVNSLKRLLLQHNDPNGKSPVYIADIIKNGQSILLPELQAGVLKSRINWSGYGSQYPLLLSEGRNNWNTPALDLFRVFCQQNNCGSTLDWLSNPSPMTLYWGARTDPVMKHVTNNQGCRIYSDGFWGSLKEAGRLLVANSIMGLYSSAQFDQIIRQPCPYSRFLFANQLKMRGDTIEELLKDKVVIFGGIFSGIPDYVVSPVHGQIPGMFMHAMAIDNLITMGADYLREPESMTSLSVFNWADLIELLLVTLLLWGIAYAARKDWLSSLTHKLLLFTAIFAGLLVTALVMSLLLNYSPVNVIGILLLMAYAISVSDGVEPPIKE